MSRAVRVGDGEGVGRAEVDGVDDDLRAGRDDDHLPALPPDGQFGHVQPRKALVVGMRRGRWLLGHELSSVAISLGSVPSVPWGSGSL